MTTTEKNDARLEKMRANLSALENEAETILSKETITAADRAALLRLVNVAYHSSGKIEGCFSVDSSVSCPFCKGMREAANKDSLIICGGCYAAAEAWKEAARRRHELNARILSTVLFTTAELSTLPIMGTLCRYNEDGDTDNDIMGINYLRIAAGHPFTHFGYWFKNVSAVAAALKHEGIRTRADLPENVRFIQSSIRIGFPCKPAWFADATFTVYPDAETTAEAIADGAHECNGRKCKDCGYTCYLMDRPETPRNIAEILRISKARRAAIVSAVAACKAGKTA